MAERFAPAFLSPLELEVLDDERFRLVVPLVYRSRVLGDTLVIPEGFLTDLASVPRLPLVFWWYGGRARKASVPHDFLYQRHLVGKATADQVFLEAMALIDDLPAPIRWTMYQGVVWGGGSAWRSGPSRYQVLGNPACMP
jgi:hypothetical protein